MGEEDVLMITADHGCDPSTPSTDHSREYTPLVMYGAPVRAGENFGTRKSFSDIAATILSYFDLTPECAGEAIPDVYKRQGLRMWRQGTAEKLCLTIFRCM